MQKVLHKLYTIRQAYKETIEGQKYDILIELKKVGESFQIKLGKVKEELHQVKVRSIILKYEINTQKGQK